jgi:hypothetical protein
MAMIAGSVTVNQSNGTWTGTGMAEAIMNVLQPALIAEVPNPSAPGVTVGISNGARDLSNSLATAVVTYIQANATANAATNSLGSGIPASPVSLPIT